MRSITASSSVLAGALLCASCLEPAGSAQLTLALDDDKPMLANGHDRRTVTVHVPDDTGYGKPLSVTTNVGFVNPSATGEARRALALSTNGGNDLTFTLFAETKADDGILAVSGPGGLSATQAFRIEALDGQLALKAPPMVGTNDGFVDLELSLTASHDDSRTVTLTATSGVLSPASSGDAKLTTSVSLSASTPRTLRWQPTRPGAAVISAGFAGEPASAEVEVLVQDPERSVTLSVAPGRYVADGASQIPIGVGYESGPGVKQAITLSTSGGSLGTSGASATVQLTSGGSTTVPLTVGRNPGKLLLSALVDGNVVASAAVDLEPAAPSVLGVTVTPSTVFTMQVRSGSVTASFAREVGQGGVSIGTRVRFAACCADGGSALVDCSSHLSIPSFAIDSQGADRVTTVLQLTPTGDAFVTQTGSPPVDDLAGALFTFVLAGGETSSPSCEQLAAPTLPGGVQVLARTPLLLRKQAR